LRLIQRSGEVVWYW